MNEAQNGGQDKTEVVDTFLGGSGTMSEARQKQFVNHRTCKLEKKVEKMLPSLDSLTFLCENFLSSLMTLARQFLRNVRYRKKKKP